MRDEREKERSKFKRQISLSEQQCKANAASAANSQMNEVLKPRDQERGRFVRVKEQSGSIEVERW